MADYNSVNVTRPVTEADITTFMNEIHGFPPPVESDLSKIVLPKIDFASLNLGRNDGEDF